MRAPGHLGLVALLGGSGALHLTRPRTYEAIVPRQLGRARPWVYGSGVAELACAVGLLAPRTRSVAGMASAALLVGVFPANVQMAVTALRSERASTAYRAGCVLRLPVQVPLVLWALRVSRGAAR